MKLIEKVVRTDRVKRLLDAMNSALLLVVERLGQENHRGGVHCAFLPDSVPGEHQQVIEQIGRIPNDKVEEHRASAISSACVLLQQYRDDKRRHRRRTISNWQFRERYGPCGGAIRAGVNAIISFSGLTEHGNEAVSMLAAGQLGWLNFWDAERIANISANQVFFDLSQKIVWPTSVPCQ